MSGGNAARADIDKTWKSLAELKEEIYRTEEKIISSEKISFTWNGNAAVEKKPVRSKNNSERNVKRKVFARSVNTGLKENHTGVGQQKTSHLNQNGVTDVQQLLILEDQPKLPPHKTSSEDSKDIRERLISSAIRNRVFRSSLEDTDASSSSSSVHRKQLHYNFGNELLTSRFSVTDSATQTQHAKRISSSQTSEVSTKVKFSKWEKDFLQREISDFEHSENGTISSTIVRETRVLCLNEQSLKSYVRPCDPRPKLRPAVTLPGSLEKVKDIIAKQREKHEKALSEADFGDFSKQEPVKAELIADAADEFSRIKPANYKAIQKYPVAQPDSNPVPCKVDAEVQANPPVVRKTTAVPYPPEYKGFCIYGKKDVKHAELKDSHKNYGSEKETKSCGDSEKRSSSKRRKKTTGTKASANKKISPFSWRAGQKLILKELGPVPNVSSKLKDAQPTFPSQHDGSDSLSEIHSFGEYGDIALKSHPEVAVINGETNADEHLNKSKLASSKTDDKENSFPLSEHDSDKDISIIKDLNDGTDAAILLSPTKSSSQKSPVSKKRKASKPPEQKGPSPKIRHYDQEKVREYIRKQKTERRKKVQEEKEKFSETQKAKNERLQKLYDHQKVAAKTVVKPQVPPYLKPRPDNSKVVQRVEESSLPKDIIRNFQPQQKPQLSPKKSSSSTYHEQPIANAQTQEPCKEKGKPTEQKISISKDCAPSTEPKITHSVTDSSDKEPEQKDAHVPSSSIPDAVISADFMHAEFSRSHGDSRSQVNYFNNVNTRKAEELKSMALLIQHQVDRGCKQLENLLRTKSWVQSRSVYTTQSGGFVVEDESSAEDRPLNDLTAPTKDNLAANNGLSEDPENCNTFRERMPGIGNMQELYSRLLEEDSHSFVQQSSGGILENDSESEHADLPPVLFDSNVESDENLSEGPLDSEDDVFDEHNGYLENTKNDSDRLQLNGTVKPYSSPGAHVTAVKDPAITVVPKPKPMPDPFNFINTYIRKPLTISSSFGVEGTSRQVNRQSDMNAASLPLSSINDTSESGSSSLTPDVTGSKGETSQLKGQRSISKEVNSFHSDLEKENSYSKCLELDKNSEKSVSHTGTSKQLLSHSGKGVISRSEHLVHSSAERAGLASVHLSKEDSANAETSVAGESLLMSSEIKESVPKKSEDYISSSSSEEFEPTSRDKSSSVISEIISAADSTDGDQSVEEQISKQANSVDDVSIKSESDIINMDDSNIKRLTKDSDEDDAISSVKEIDLTGSINSSNASGSTLHISEGGEAAKTSSEVVSSVLSEGPFNEDDVPYVLRNIKEIDFTGSVSSPKENGSTSHTLKEDDIVKTSPEVVSSILSEGHLHGASKDDEPVKISPEIVSSILSEGILSDNNSIVEENSASRSHDITDRTVHDNQEDIANETPSENESRMDIPEKNDGIQELDSLSFSPKCLDFTSSHSAPKILTSTHIMPNGQNRSPSILDLHLRSNLTHLESLQDSLIHLAEINRIHSGVSADVPKGSVAVSQVLQVSHPAAMPSDQMFSTHVVTRVATEAATAAATSAVIAVLESRKSLLNKKQFVDLADTELSPSSKNESYHYSSDFEISPKTSDTSPASSEQSKTLSRGTVSPVNHSGHENSIPEEGNAPMENSNSDGSRSPHSSIAEQMSRESNLADEISNKSIETEHVSSKSNVVSSGRSQKVSSRSSVEDQLPARSISVDQVSSKASVIEQTSPVGSIIESISNQSNAGKHISSESNIAEQLSNLVNIKEPQSDKKRKRSGNVSSPSPASLSDDDLLSSATISSSNSSVTQSSQQSLEFQSMLSEDSFAQFTLDMVRRMSREEELRAKHQLSVLQFQEKALVEKARAEMTWLEILKRKLQQKGADKKIRVINKRQQDLAVRLRQERAQLHCMQETYRSVSKKHQALLSEKKKLLTDSNLLGFDLTGKKERMFGSPHYSHDKNSEVMSVIKSQSRASSTNTSSLATEDNNEILDEDSAPDVPDMVRSSSNASSAESLVETQVTSQSKASHLSVSRTSKSSQQITTRHLKSEAGSSTRLSHQPSHSLESILQGLKRLEASKRYLTKKEQRLLQRRKEVESLLQWQKKLDNEESAIKELEKKVLDSIDDSKRKKYAISSSNLNTLQENSSSGENGPLSVKTTVSKDVSTEAQSHTFASTQIETSSVPSDTTHHTVASEDSIEEQLPFPEKKYGSVSEETIGTGQKSSESSVGDEFNNVHVESFENIPEDIIHSQSQSNITEEANSFKSSAGSLTSKENLSVVSANAYSESFESSSETQISSNTVLQPKSSSSLSGTNGRKTRGITIRSPLIPHSHRRHDSSGSDDSYTISHSETASDQSDIEGRIHALTEELKSRKSELEKLKRERKKRYREQLKEKEKSLQKQLEAYDQHIQQTRLELEQQLEAASASPPHSLEYSPSAVKPQIKKPCVAESRRLCKQSSLSTETSPSEKKSSETLSRTSANNRETSLDDSEEIKVQSSLTKKFPISGSKVPYKDISGEEDNQSVPSISTENSSILSNVGSDKNGIKTSGVQKSASFEDTSQKSASLEDSSHKSASLEDTSNNGESTKKLSLEEEKKFEENSSDEILEDLILTGSDKNVSNSKTLQNESSEGDSLTDSHGTISEGVIPDEDGLNVSPIKTSTNYNLPSSPLDEYAPDKPPVPNLNETFILEKQDVTFVVDETDEDDKCDIPIAQVSISDDQLDDEVKSVLSCDLKSKGKSSPQLQKSSASVIIDGLVSTLSNDSVFYMLQVAHEKQGIHNETFAVVETDSPSDHLKKSHSLRTIHEKAAIQVSEMLTESLLKDAIKVILNTFRKSQDDDSPGVVQNASQKVVDILANLDGKKISSGNSRPQDLMVLSPSLEEDFTWVDENLPASQPVTVSHDDKVPPIQRATSEKEVEIDFNADQEWFEDEFVTANNQSQVQQFDQQLLLQQYPYYYRQIPNKPPPPYTPPSTSSSESGTSVVPFSPPRPKKPVEPLPIIPCTQEAVCKVVDKAVETLLQDIQKGLPIASIQPKCHDLESPEEDIVLQCQQSYNNFLFDLTKECASDLYGETEETPKPWIKSRKLTRKPQLPCDKEELTNSVQKEVFSVLKLPAAQTQGAPTQRSSLWSAMKLGRKKRDFVDNILICELKDEEPDWVNYDHDELTVKFQLSNSICDVLVDDTVKHILHMLSPHNEVPELRCPNR